MSALRHIPALLAVLALTISCGQRSGSQSNPETQKAKLTATSHVMVPEDVPAPAELSSPEQPSTLVEAEPAVPSIRFVSRGSILPSTGKMDLLFVSCLYAKAQVRIQRVHQSNILQFMQQGMDRWCLTEVASALVDTTITLGIPSAPHLRQERTYGLSLDELITPDPGSIYHVEIRGREPLEDEDFYDSEWAFGDYATIQDRSVNLLTSDLTLIAKRSDKAVIVTAMDILSGKPVAEARIKAYNYVQQELACALTDANGRAVFKGQDEARFITATHGRSSAYLDLRSETSLSTSGFDVGGASHEGGIRAYLFGERGVWRPGDTLHICAVTMCDSPLPAAHPVVAELRNPDGQLVQTLSAKAGDGSIFHFPFTTQADAPTGRWSAVLKIGGQSFTKALKVETIKPNKLDIDLRFDKPYVTPSAKEKGLVSVNWLYGAKGAGLKVDGEVEITPAPTAFKGYEEYDFKDDARAFDTQNITIKELATDSEGNCTLTADMAVNTQQAPGFLDAEYTLRAFEPSGEFSTAIHNVRLSPFGAYVGMRTTMDRSEWGDEFLKSGKPHRFDVVTLDPDGRGIEVPVRAEIYHVDWSWWWSASSSIATYMSGSSRELLYAADISGKDGKCSFSYDWANDPSGLYYILVKDKDGGHATSMLCEVYESVSTRADSDAATKLAINVSGSSFEVGQTAKVSFPSAAGATALVSLEKGGTVLSTTRVSCTGTTTEVSIPVTSGMAPNTYVNISLIQPHGNVLNDAPIRLYGVANINVEDKASHLHPVVSLPSEAKPESRLSFKVSEQDGRAMSYIVALVDEGLLSLTGFKTPDAWKSFYAKEALRVRTWDAYDNIIGAYGGRIEQLFAIGGDDEANAKVKRKGADRFPPVVACLGPFSLKAGRTATHTFDIPQYTGSLRAMVIATDGHAQGSCQSDVEVTMPVMVQAALPRTLATGETVKVPATVMALKDGVGKVKLDIAVDGPVKLKGPASQSVDVPKAGQTVSYFELEVGDKPGIAHVCVTARGAGETSRSSVEVDVFNPNPAMTRTTSALVEAGQSKTLDADIFGMQGTNELEVELSSIPAINLKGRLKYLIDYPYGCVEQTVSAAFPQLYLDKIMACDEQTRERCVYNVQAAIRRLQSYRLGSGALSYWPGQGVASSFGTVYALHFLQEAENRGYAVPAELKFDLIRYAATSIASASGEPTYTRAYATYALALAGKPQRSAMNNLRSKCDDMPYASVWMLAAAYACDGKKDVAKSICEGLPYYETEDARYAYGYGSKERNMALALYTMIMTGQNQSAFELASELAAKLNDQKQYMSTQTTSWALYAISSYAQANGSNGVHATVKLDGKTAKADTDKSVATLAFDPAPQSGKASVNITNSGTGIMYATVAVTGTPEAGKETAASNGLSLKVEYVGKDGRTVVVDTLSRGRTIKAMVTVINNGKNKVSDIALVQRFPSGWEILNDRLGANGSAPVGVTYQDIRDDRVCSFFDLNPGKQVKIVTGLTAAYPGKFFLPAISCEAMYDAAINASLPGRWIEVK